MLPFCYSCLFLFLSLFTLFLYQLLSSFPPFFHLGEDDRCLLGRTLRGPLQYSLPVPTYGHEAIPCLFLLTYAHEADYDMTFH